MHAFRCYIFAARIACYSGPTCLNSVLSETSAAPTPPIATHPDVLPFGVQQLENNFSDALRVGKRPQRGVECSINDTAMLLQRHMNERHDVIASSSLCSLT